VGQQDLAMDKQTSSSKDRFDSVLKRLLTTAPTHKKSKTPSKKTTSKKKKPA
jgi:hypothetical protein